MNTTSSSFWLDRPTLVTGATGLVGGFVVQHLLEKGANVVSLIRDWVPQCALMQSGAVENVTTVHGELEDKELLERVLNEYEIVTVLHLAAQAVVGVANRNPVSTFESNVKGTWRLLEACRRAPTVKQIVVASSDKAYGDQENLPYQEDMPLRARNPYDVSKACADLIAQSYAHTFDMPVAISRCGNFYGEGDLNWNRIVPGTIRSALRKNQPVIRSDGTFIRDYLYVDDGALAYLLLAEKLADNPDLKGHAFNFSTETPLSVLEITQKILSLMQSDLQPDIQDVAKNEIERQFLSARKAQEMLGWQPQYTLDMGLKKTIEWYESFLKLSE
jgi:CDP-glucose 4,6-dehydratase